MSEETKGGILFGAVVTAMLFAVPWFIAFVVLNGNHSYKWWENRTPLYEEIEGGTPYENCEVIGGSYSLGDTHCLIGPRDTPR